MFAAMLAELTEYCDDGATWWAFFHGFPFTAQYCAGPCPNFLAVQSRLHCLLPKEGGGELTYKDAG